MHVVHRDRSPHREGEAKRWDLRKSCHRQMKMKRPPAGGLFIASDAYIQSALRITPTARPSMVRC